MSRIRILNFNDLANNLFPNWKKNFETLSNWVLHKYGDDIEFQELIRSFGFKLPLVSSQKQAGLEFEDTTDPQIQIKMIKPCSVKLVRLESENQAFRPISNTNNSNSSLTSNAFSTQENTTVKARKTVFNREVILSLLKPNSEKKQITCEICKKSFPFNLKSNLKVHQRTHTGEKPYKCKHCSKAFSRSYGLKVHERVHTGEKPYKCKHCSKAFSQSPALKAHERIHTGEKPYECIFCGMKFITMCKLKSHLCIHTGEKPFECQTCGEFFKSKPGLRKHEEKLH